MKRPAVAMSLAFVFGLIVASPAGADELDPGFDDPAPTPIVVPAGLYLVTEVYAGNVVTAYGGTTSYTTTTVHASPGTYARVLESVSTGQPSRFDGRSFNGRADLADGRAIAGTYYETFVLTPNGFVSVSIVFFQDDSETRAAVVSKPEPSAVPITMMPPVVLPQASQTEPQTAWPIAQATAAPASRPATAPAPTFAFGPASSPRPANGSAGIALAPDGPTLAAIEILRGRRVALWPHAFVDGVAVPIRSWLLVSGSADVLPRTAGDNGEPCEAAWLSFAPDDAPWRLQFEVMSDALPGRVMTATIAVTIRSPALLQ